MTHGVSSSAAAVRFHGWLTAAPHRLLGLWLGVLHLGLLQGIDSAVGKTLLLAHLGMFLMWQPVVRGAYRLGWRDVLFMSMAVVLFVVGMSWGGMAIWMMVLAGVVGGGAFIEHLRRARLPYQLAVAYLVSSLFMLVLPEVVPIKVAEHDLFRALALSVLPLMVLAIVFFPLGDTQRAAFRAIDFISAILLFLVLAVTTLGALVFMWLQHLPYLVAILTAVFSMAAVLLVLAWAWHPRMGGPQLGAQFARRILSAGMSFEEWLHRVAALSVTGQTPQAFLGAACEQLTGVPGVRGGRWAIDEGEGAFGRCEGVERMVVQGGLTLRVYLLRADSPALLWHLNLMACVLAEFCREKRHARQLETLSYVRAVHETGARLTHDVKNLLQSLNTLCFTATRPDVDPDTLRKLAGKQLPVITQRLEQTLDKLRIPVPAAVESVPAVAWWEALCARHEGDALMFSSEAGLDGVVLPGAVFSAAADNLIQNALDKRVLDPAVSVHVRLGTTGAQAWLEVEDSGMPVPDAIAAALFKAPVASESGLGMGVYQVAQHAAECGFRLHLSANQRGCVRFRLDQAFSD
ncbi:MAG: hypothetical protein KDF24_08815 [Rhodocyclaceae bacterium]|nr:hypothetical protein [Rhodocyclaceae bacterium]